MPTPFQFTTSVLGSAGMFGSSFPDKVSAISEAYSTWLSAAQISLVFTGVAGSTGSFSAFAAGVPGTTFILQGLASSGVIGPNAEFLSRALGIGLFSIPYALTGVCPGCGPGVGVVSGFSPTLDLASLIRSSYVGRGLLPSLSETDGIALGINLAMPTMIIGRTGPVIGATFVPTSPISVPFFGKIL